LLLAGPGEQLQRLFAGQVMERMQRGEVGLGEFNSMSEGMKRMVYEGMGGDAGALVRQERAILNGRQLTVEQQQAGRREAQGRIDDWGGRVGQFTRERLDRQPVATHLSTLEKRAQNAGEQLSGLAKSAAIADARLKDLGVTLKAVLKDLRGGGSDFSGSNAAAARLGLATGFALGAY
jgi:hypothetical protein